MKRKKGLNKLTVQDAIRTLHWFCTKCGSNRDMLSAQTGICSHCDNDEFVEVPKHIPRSQQSEYVLKTMIKKGGG